VETVTVYVYESSRVYYPESYYPPEYYGYGYPYSNTNYPTGSVTVTSDPSDAIVIIDGYNSGTTPHVFTGLSTGYHTVEVNYPGYEAYITQVYVEGGGNMEVAADLVPLVTYGSLFIDSTPQGADVFVDGNYEGTSPVTVGSLSEGPHQLELHLAGYEVYTSTENVVEGQAQVLNIALAPYSSSSADGSIAVTSSRPGALVYLDGVYKGSTQSGIPFNIIAVSPGSHTVLLSAPGYQDVTQAVQVYAGQVSTMNAVFIPSGTASQAQGTSGQGSGSIFVTSSPAGGQVSIDGQFRGVAPVTIYNVASGSHIVNLNSPGMTTGRVRSMSRQTRWCR
jgi:archaellum component FlaG (FlaF/FlaG flagellin family)